MSSLTRDPYLPVVLPSVGATDGNRREDSIRSLVGQVLLARQPARNGRERRRERRYPYPHPIHLTPIDTSGAEPAETIVVIGKQLSAGGVGFYYREPIAFRRVIASFDVGEQGWIGLLLELTWCRFNRHGWYDSGGQFLAVVESPLEIERRTSA